MIARRFQCRQIRGARQESRGIPGIIARAAEGGQGGRERERRDNAREKVKLSGFSKVRPHARATYSHDKSRSFFPPSGSISSRAAEASIQTSSHVHADLGQLNCSTPADCQSDDRPDGFNSRRRRYYVPKVAGDLVSDF